MFHDGDECDGASVAKHDVIVFGFLRDAEKLHGVSMWRKPFILVEKELKKTTPAGPDFVF